MLGGNTYGTLVALNPNDTNNLSPLPQAIYVGATGDVTVEAMDGSSVKFVAVPAGTTLPIACRKVKATGTSATNLVGMSG